MPLYDFECPNCLKRQEELRAISKRHNGPLCRDCGVEMKFVLSPPPKPTDHLYPYMHENLGHEPVEIRSLRHLRAEQKKRGLVDGGKPRGVHGQWV